MLSPVKIWRNQKKIASLVGKTGTVVSWTVVRVPPADFVDQAPYPVVLLALDNGKKLTAQLVDWDRKNLIFGQRVITVVRRVEDLDQDGVIPYGIKAKPI